MPSIWAIEMTLKPAGAMTFRQMPSGQLHIMTYPFLPPTTMSGFLERLRILSEGGQWPGYGDDWFGKGPGKKFTLTLSCDYRAVGAFPKSGQWSIHKTRRQGPKDFKHKDFSRLLQSGKRENYQLHHWDYLFCETLTGWILTKDKSAMEIFPPLKNYGGKVGKEGYLVIDRIGSPQKLQLKKGEYRPLGLVTPPTRPGSGRFFNLYGHYWDKSYEWSNGEKGGVNGFIQLGAWWQADKAAGPYWAIEDGVGFAAHMPDDFFQGETEPFFQAEQD